MQKIRHMKILKLQHKIKARNGVEQITNGLKMLLRTGLQNEFDEQMVLNAIQRFYFCRTKRELAKEAVRLNAENALTELDENLNR